MPLSTGFTRGYAQLDPLSRISTQWWIGPQWWIGLYSALEFRSFFPIRISYLVLRILLKVRNLHMRLNQVRARFGHKLAGFLADFGFPVVQVGSRTD